METRQDFRTVSDLVELKKNDIARANPEYQRGIVWTRDQQMKLIDSVMRGYQLPVIYLHYIKRTIAGMTRESYEIIDGQQRLQALHLFVEGSFRLYAANDEKARFPKFLKEQPCPWGEKNFQELSDELKQRLLETRLPVAFIETDNDNEVRDLFVRLQAGFPLNAQEKRDSYPGQFTDFILKLGGKPEIPRYPGHDFFKRVLGMKPGQDRGKTRQLAAQIAVQFLERHNNNPEYFSDINAQAIDNYYYVNLDFDSESASCNRLLDILSKLEQLLHGRKGPRLRAHDAMHMVLLLDSIWDDYTRSWEDKFAGAQDKFSQAIASASVAKSTNPPDPFWSQYGMWTRTNADRGETIRHRHRFYCLQMEEFLGGLTMKDTNRAFGPLEREVIYWRDEKRCGYCKAEVVWAEAEIHHIEEHSKGGKTELKNGVLMHRHCHPKGQAAVEFAERWKAQQEQKAD